MMKYCGFRVRQAKLIIICVSIVFSIVTIRLMVRVETGNLQENQHFKNSTAVGPTYIIVRGRDSSFTDIPSHVQNQVQPLRRLIETNHFHSTPCGCLRHVVYNNGSSLQEVNSTCSMSAMERGPGQRVVSFSFYGSLEHERGYFQGIEENAMLMPHFYPGWVMRVYHKISEKDQAIINKICKLECQFPFLDFCNVSETPLHGNLESLTAMAWRFLPLGDPQVDFVVSRDLDSRFSLREIHAVSEWIKSGKTWHVMKDHPNHVGFPILGGMWGANVQNIRGLNQNVLKSILDLLNKGDELGQDQKMLQQAVWPYAKGKEIWEEEVTVYVTTVTTARKNLGKMSALGQPAEAKRMFRTLSVPLSLPPIPSKQFVQSNADPEDIENGPFAESDVETMIKLIFSIICSPYYYYY